MKARLLLLLLPAAAAAAGAAVLASSLPPDTAAVKAKRAGAERILEGLKTQRSEILDEEHKFKEETDRLDDQARRLAVERLTLERSVETVLGSAYPKYNFELGKEILERLERELALELEALEAEKAALESGRRALAEEVDSMLSRMRAAPQDERDRIAGEALSRQAELAALDSAIAGAAADVDRVSATIGTR